MRVLAQAGPLTSTAPLLPSVAGAATGARAGPRAAGAQGMQGGGVEHLRKPRAVCRARGPRDVSSHPGARSQVSFTRNCARAMRQRRPQAWPLSRCRFDPGCRIGSQRAPLHPAACALDCRLDSSPLLCCLASLLIRAPGMCSWCRSLEEQGVDLVFLPTSDMMYPPEFDTWVQTDVGSGRNEGAVKSLLPRRCHDFALTRVMTTHVSRTTVYDGATRTL